MAIQSLLIIDKRPKLKVAPESVKRLKDDLREIFRKGRGRSITKVIDELNKKLNGWANYFKLTEVKLIFEDLDKWIHHIIRCIIWRQWKRVYCRAKNLIKRGLTKDRALKSSMNGRGSMVELRLKSHEPSISKVIFREKWTRVTV